MGVLQDVKASALQEDWADKAEGAAQEAVVAPTRDLLVALEQKD